VSGPSPKLGPNIGVRLFGVAVGMNAPASSSKISHWSSGSGKALRFLTIADFRCSADGKPSEKSHHVGSGVPFDQGCCAYVLVRRTKRASTKKLPSPKG